MNADLEQKIEAAWAKYDFRGGAQVAAIKAIWTAGYFAGASDVQDEWIATLDRQLNEVNERIKG